MIPQRGKAKGTDQSLQDLRTLIGIGKPGLHLRGVRLPQDAVRRNEVARQRHHIRIQPVHRLDRVLHEVRFIKIAVVKVAELRNREP